MKKYIALAVLGFAVSAQAGNFTNQPLPKMKITLEGINRLAWSTDEVNDSGGATAHAIIKYSIPASYTNGIPSGVTIKTWDCNLNMSFALAVTEADIAAASGTNSAIKTKRALNKKEDEVAAWLKATLP